VLRADVVEVKAAGTFTQLGGFLEARRFNLAGGKVQGTLHNRGLFDFSSGVFQGKLINEGRAMLGANTGKVATSEAGAGAQMEIEVSGEGSSLVIASANQDLKALVVRHENDGLQGFDLASGGGAGEYRLIRIYPGDEAAMAEAERGLRGAIGNALSSSGDGIFDSGLDERPGTRVGIGRRVDLHQDGFLLMRPTVIGDLNLDGRVSISDFIDLAANFQSMDATWDKGDVNYDGSVTIADFIELAANFGMSYSGEVVPISSDDQRQLNAFATANVPEVNCICLWGIVGIGAAMRRRHGRGAHATIKESARTKTSTSAKGGREDS
jgi:hypothetical protein